MGKVMNNTRVSIFAAAAVGGALLLAGCGTSSEGSRYNAQHGVAMDSQYPKQQPVDSGSPALASMAKEPEGEGKAAEGKGAEGKKLEEKAEVKGGKKAE